MAARSAISGSYRPISGARTDARWLPNTPFEHRMVYLSGTSLMVVERLVDHQQDAFAGSIGLVRIRTGGRVLGEHRLELQAQARRVINEEAAIRAEAGVKCEPEQSPLSARFKLGSDVEERHGDESAILDDADPSILLEDKEASGTVVGNFHPRPATPGR